jgi:hypothetical protein
MALLSLPTACIRVMAVLAPVFAKPVGPQVKVRCPGALRAPGQRTMTAALCVMGLSAAAHVQPSHRVLHRAVWSPLGARRLLLKRLVAVCVPAGVVVCGLDATLERRRGGHLQAHGIDRDPVRSSRAHVVNVSGRRGRWCRLLPPRG